MKLAAPTPGTVLLGKYRVERVLGAGGMGVVLEATHLVLGKTFALKVLSPDVTASSDVIARFLREAQIAAQLPADHIAHVTDVGMTETGSPYLVMELLIGRDLDKELAERGRLPVTEAIDHVLQACEGVAEAHAVGLVHRDLKPANLFLTRRRNGAPVIKVLDFGLSKVRQADGVTSLTVTNSSFGTPQYMSPEQVRDSKHVDARCDQHALAMILYELLTGVPPYDGMNVTELVTNIALKPAPLARELRPEVPVEVEAAIVRALEKDPEKRFADLRAFARALAPFAGESAQGTARNISAILSERKAPPPNEPTPEPLGDDSDQKLTVMRLPPGDRRAQSVGAVTSSARNLRKKKHQLLAAALAAGASVLALAAVVALIAQHRRGDVDPLAPAATAAAAPPAESPAPIEAPSEGSAATGAPTVTPPEVAPAPPTASAAAPPAPPPSASPPRPSATAKAPPPPRPPPPPPATAKAKAPQSDIDIFGGKR